MYITDLSGKRIDITDLPKAIGQVETYTGYYHLDKRYSDFDKQVNAYWNDVLMKLRRLEQRKTEQI